MTTHPTYIHISRNRVGRLTLDRYDFKQHVDGTAFNHEATGILLVPGLDIDGYYAQNVRSALEALITGGGTGDDCSEPAITNQVQHQWLDSACTAPPGAPNTLVFSSRHEATIDGLGGANQILLTLTAGIDIPLSDSPKLTIGQLDIIFVGSGQGTNACGTMRARFGITDSDHITNIGIDQTEMDTNGGSDTTIDFNYLNSPARLQARITPGTEFVSSVVFGITTQLTMQRNILPPEG